MLQIYSYHISLNLIFNRQVITTQSDHCPKKKYLFFKNSWPFSHQDVANCQLQIPDKLLKWHRCSYHFPSRLGNINKREFNLSKENKISVTTEKLKRHSQNIEISVKEYMSDCEYSRLFLSQKLVTITPPGPEKPAVVRITGLLSETHSECSVKVMLFFSVRDIIKMLTEIAIQPYILRLNTA